jgi:hypothetical protein
MRIWFLSFYLCWITVLSIVLLRIRDNRFRVSLPVLFLLVTLAAVFFGALAAANRM